MTKEKKETQEVAEEPRRSYRGVASIIIITVIIITLFTGIMAYGVQSVTGAGEAERDEGVMLDGVKEFRLLGPQWEFEPRLIKMNPGDTVRFIVTSPDITHGFAINELGVNISFSPGLDGVQEVVIPPDIAEGTYTVYCSIFCGSGHSHMKGTVIIGEPAGFEIGKILPYVATGAMAGMFGVFITIGRRRAR